jgi:hypothetical protein
VFFADDVVVFGESMASALVKERQSIWNSISAKDEVDLP